MVLYTLYDPDDMGSCPKVHLPGIVPAKVELRAEGGRVDEIAKDIEDLASYPHTPDKETINSFCNKYNVDPESERQEKALILVLNARRDGRSLELIEWHPKSNQLINKVTLPLKEQKEEDGNAACK